MFVCFKSNANLVKNYFLKKNSPFEIFRKVIPKKKNKNDSTRSFDFFFFYRKRVTTDKHKLQRWTPYDMVVILMP